MTTFIVKTIGCKANQYDGQLIREGLLAGGCRPWSEGDGRADICVVNTCAVTRSSDSKSRRAVRRLVREHPGATVVVTGCGAENSPREFAALPGVSRVLGNSAKARVARIVAGSGSALSISGFAGHSRAFIKIQDGCGFGCSYCIVPRVRGRPFSRPHDEIVREAAALASAGYREIVLSGIHLGAYGADRAEHGALEGLIRALEKAGGIARIRLSSIEPGEVSDELIGIMAEGGALCPHLHVPLQSGDDGILREMRRGYTAGAYADLVEKIRRQIPDISLTTDVMVGFPGETEPAFGNTLGMVRRAGFSRVHVFPYSPRPGTPAFARGDPVSREVKTRRAAALRGAADETARRYRERFPGRAVEVLVQGRGDAKRAEGYGLSREYLRVYFTGGSPEKGSIAGVSVEKVTPGGLEGSLITM